MVAPVSSYLETQLGNIIKNALAYRRAIEPGLMAIGEAALKFTNSIQPLAEQMHAQWVIMEAALSPMIQQLHGYYAGIEKLAQIGAAVRIPSVFSDDALRAMQYFLKRSQEMYKEIIEQFNKFSEFIAFTQEEEFKNFDLNWLAFLPLGVMKKNL